MASKFGAIFSRGDESGCITGLGMFYITHKWLEMQGCILSTGATVALVLKHQGSSSHNADKIFIVSDQSHTKISQLLGKIQENKPNFEKNILNGSTHLCRIDAVNRGSIGSGNGLLSVRLQAITWTNADFLSIGTLGANVTEFQIGIRDFSFMRMHLKILSVKWHPLCPGGDELRDKWQAHPLPVSGSPVTC